MTQAAEAVDTVIKQTTIAAVVAAAISVPIEPIAAATRIAPARNASAGHAVIRFRSDRAGLPSHSAQFLTAMEFGRGDRPINRPAAPESVNLERKATLPPLCPHSDICVPSLSDLIVVGQLSALKPRRRNQTRGTAPDHLCRVHNRWVLMAARNARIEIDTKNQLIRVNIQSSLY
jgi:hypothetical protein